MTDNEIVPGAAPQSEQASTTDETVNSRETGNGQQSQSIRVNLTAEDYAGFNLYHGRRQLAGLFLFYWCLIVIAARLTELAVTPVELAIVICAAFALSGLLLAYQLWRIKTRTIRLFESDKSIKVEQHIALTTEGIRHTTGDTTVQMAWDDVHKVAESAKAVIVYLARNKVIMLPKRDIGDVDQVKSILRLHLPASKLKLKP